jgi:hypothetical protein
LISNWRDYILQHFREPIHRLTLVADPDGLMLEEELLAAIRQNGFDLLPFEDPIAFRYAYESSYRQHWDQGQDTDLVVILRSPGSSLRSLPYDLLQSGRTLTFSLPDLLPRLSYPVVSELELVYLQSLYDAYQRDSGPEMGDRASALFVLKHVFGLVPDVIKTPADLLKLLLSRHTRGERVPPRLDALLFESLSRHRVFNSWPLESLLRNATDFFAFLQGQWASYLASLQPAGTPIHESGLPYTTTDLLETSDSPLATRHPPLPFDEPDVRAYVDTLFLDGKLKPFPLSDGWTVEGWAQIGVEFDERAFELRRFTGLLERLERELPAADSTHRDWIEFATRWAELTVLHHRLAPDLSAEMADQYKTLHLTLEERFADWMMVRYHTLHSLPFLPLPVMVHRIPHYMAAYRDQHPESRLALVVVDGLALDQWLVIRDVWAENGVLSIRYAQDHMHRAADAVQVAQQSSSKGGQTWSMQQDVVFAWVPTLTPISRQAAFAGVAPQFFPDSWRRTDRDALHWQRFWHERGLHPANVGYLRNLGVKDPILNLSKDLEPDGSVRPDGEAILETEVEELLQNPQHQVIGLVINTVDNIMHGMQLGTAGMHQQVQLWLTRYRYLTKLVSRLIQESFTVYLTSDHGNVWAQGVGRPSEGVLVDKRGERARLYSDPAFLALAKKAMPTAIEWTNVGLPEGLQVLLAPGLDAFLDKGHHAVCHGGIALEEVVVPFVQISARENATV